MGLPGLSIALFVATCSGTVHAETYAERIGAVHAALAASDTKAAKKLLKDAERMLSSSEVIVPGGLIARLYFLRGVDAIKRGKDDAAMDEWRRALVIQNDYVWDATLLPDRDLHRLFEALRTEVRTRGEVEVGAPEQTGSAQLFLDGNRVYLGDQVIVGRHLAQVSCPESGVQATWTDLAGGFDWLGLCPEDVDTTVVAAGAVDEDEFGGMAPVFGVPAGDPGVAAAPPEPPPAAPPAPEPPPEVAKEVPPEPEPEPEPDPEPEPAPAEEEPVVVADAEEATSAGEDAEAEEQSEETPPPEKPARQRLRLNEIAPGMYMMAGGGVLVVGGAIMNFAAVNPAWGRIEAARAKPSSVNRTEADQLTKRFNLNRGITLGMIGGGLALTGAGVFFLEGPVSPFLNPSGIGMAGRW